MISPLSVLLFIIIVVTSKVLPLVLLRASAQGARGVGVHVDIRSVAQIRGLKGRSQDSLTNSSLGDGARIKRLGEKTLLRKQKKKHVFPPEPNQTICHVSTNWFPLHLGRTWRVTEPQVSQGRVWDGGEGLCCTALARHPGGPAPRAWTVKHFITAASIVSRAAELQLLGQPVQHHGHLQGLLEVV